MVSRPQTHWLTAMTLIVSLFSWPTAICGADVVLRERVVPRGEVVHLGDLAIVQDESPRMQEKLSSLVLFPTPSQSRCYSATEIRDRLELLGVELLEVRVSGATQVEVSIESTGSEQAFAYEPVQLASLERSRDSSSVVLASDATGFRPEMVEQFVRSRTQRRLSEMGWKWQAMTIPASTRQVLDQGCRWLGAELSTQVEDELAKNSIAGDSRMISVHLIAEASGTRQSLPLTVHLAPLPQVVFLKVAVERGTILSAEHVQLRPWNGNDSTRAVANLDEVIGREVRGTITVDRPIDPAQLSLPNLVKRNTEVRIASSIPGLRVTAVGKSLADGGLNDIVPVQLSDPRRPIRGRVIGAGMVEVIGGTEF